jgi:hypothetical protein
MPTITIDYVGDVAREFGDSGAAVKMMLKGGGEAEFATGRNFVAQHIEALKKLIGQPIEVEGEQTEKFGFKLKRYPGMPAGGGGKSSRPGGSWDTPEERMWKEDRIGASVAVKVALDASLGMDPAERIAFVKENAKEVLATIIAMVPRPVLSAPASEPAASGDASVTASSGGNRVQEVLKVGSGDAHSVIRAKNLLRTSRNLGDFDLLAEQEWELFLAEFAVAESNNA